MRVHARSRVPRWSGLLLCACGGGTDLAGNAESSSSGEMPATTSTGSSSTGIESPTTSGADDTTTGSSSTGAVDSTGDPTIPDVGTVEPTCDMCSTTRPAVLNDGANEEREPGRDVAEAADGRGLAASHYLFDGRVVATFFDPIAQTWDDPEVLRDTGEWNSIEYTTVDAVRTADGVVVIEDANGDLFAHNYDDEWGHAELVSVPGYRYILDLEPAPDDRVAVLLRSTIDPYLGFGALYLAYFDPEGGEWSPDPVVLLDDPVRKIDRATIAFASDDGDALVTLASLPEVGNYPRTAELHHYDAETESWTLVHDVTAVEFFRPGLRELEPGQFAYTTDVSADEIRLFDEDMGIGDPVMAPFPDDYAAGMMRSVAFGYESSNGGPTESLTYRTYDWEDPDGTVETLDIPGPIDARAVMAQDGRAYAYWTTEGGTYDSYVAVYGPGGWQDPVMLGSATHEIFRSSFARNEAGDVVVAWTPGCSGGPCVGDPTQVAVYKEEATCWQPTLTFEGAFDARAYPFSTTRDFALVTAVEGYFGRMLGCS